MERRSGRPRVLLAACGSVASLKFDILCRTFNGWTDVIAIATKAALNFIRRESLPLDMSFYTDEMEWASWSRIGDIVLHNELQRWADVMVIAPLTANTLAKMAVGQCDNLVTCTLRAWDYSKPIFIAPCMSLSAWRHPLTEQHLLSIEQFGSIIYVPGDSGAMAEPEAIFGQVVLYFHGRELRQEQIQPNQASQASQAGGSGGQQQIVPSGSDGQQQIVPNVSDGQEQIQVGHVVGSGGEEAVPIGNGDEEEGVMHVDSDGEEGIVPIGSDSEEGIVPIGSDSEEGVVPIGSDSEEEVVPIGSDGEVGFVPIGSDGEVGVVPIGIGGGEAVVPIGSGGSDAVVPIGSGGGEEVVPNDSGAGEEVASNDSGSGEEVVPEL